MCHAIGRLVACVVVLIASIGAHAEETPRPPTTVSASVAALDQMIVYNRFGSFNPYGMVFALRRDVVEADPADGGPLANCADDLGIGNTTSTMPLQFGNVRLRDCKRPRPLVLRANVGDILEIKLENLLRKPSPGISETWCKREPTGAPHETQINNKTLELCTDTNAEKLAEAGQTPEPGDTRSGDGNWPRTRGISFVISGLVPLPDPATGLPHKVCAGLGSLAPGEPTVTCQWRVDREGTYFISSYAAPSGGEGDGGSLTHGLFGALVVEKEGSHWYRSQVSQPVFNRMWPVKEGPTHARVGLPDYDVREPSNPEGVPLLNMAMEKDGKLELVHSDLNAIISLPNGSSFREFTVVFHDELKTFYPDVYRELGDYGQLAGARDGFGINYGASGMGTMLLANRKKIGPAADCAECLYEEFFLQSWANGDPALLEMYPDDPSNVHHSYMNDEIVFRNFHAGPKETHVFHLHAHQWFGGNDGGRGSYLDSQTVGPMQGFSYNIYHGGLDKYADPAGSGSGFKGWWESLGSGNRNRTVGDSIFHCHLYPHFAQGMWELWRNHDVLEDGSRKLPDGQLTAGLSIENNDPPHSSRPGSVDENGNFLANAEGTPVPGIVPLPRKALPVLPTYGAQGMPGYPFFMPGKAGHRAPQAPLDIARDLSKPVAAPDAHLDGGLPRHVMLDGSKIEFDAKTLPAMLALGDFTGHFKSAKLKLLPYEGTPLEKRAMAFHHNGAGLSVLKPDGTAASYNTAGYETLSTQGNPSLFAINGSAPKPGAPFADPCGAPEGMIGKKKFRSPNGDLLSLPEMFASIDDPFSGDGSKMVPDPGMNGFRRYDASAVQLTLVANKAGWHDPQARINVLSKEADAAKGTVSGDREPFFFRARSGECIEFRHTNELPKDLERDDFQVRTPTDTIGQHIHLVKFDVTSSDGSGNGWNYEDGTFAPDEIASRICASESSVGGSREGAVSGSLDVRLNGRMCAEVMSGAKADYYKSKRSENIGLFQTTVQRWFADPILSCTSSDDIDPVTGLCRNSSKEMEDRTMRTVFTHDHFGPSSIQQHGFYSALLIEPQMSRFCNENGSCEIRDGDADFPLYEGTQYSVGVKKIITNAIATNKSQSIHPDYREFALAVADFAMLYDPNGRTTLEPNAKDAKGLDRLVAESHSISSCTVTGVNGGGEKERIPANCAWGDLAPAQRPTALIAALEEHAIELRAKHGRPVNPPERPESISVDHHDPYLVNYKHEPVPLRVGTDGAGRPNPFRNVPCTSTDIAPSGQEKSIKHQISGPAGDYANIFRSDLHGDPCTPVVEMYSGERLMVRLIQGAQEVQHMFTLEGFGWRRNPDQKFPSDSRLIDSKLTSGWQQKCDRRGRTGKPESYYKWLENGPALSGNPTYWKDFEQEIAQCNNLEGFMPAQEIGISEHFEFGQRIRGDASGPLSADPALASTNANAPDLGVGDSVRPTDYLYHFGTQDALWNGAWGLLRVFNSPRVTDTTRCLAEGKTIDQCTLAKTPVIGSRLPRVDDFVHEGQSFDLNEGLIQEVCDRDAGAGFASCTDPLSIQTAASVLKAPAPSLSINCPKDAPQLRAYIAAIRASDLRPGRTWYDKHKGIYDPNGLVFVLLNRADVITARRPGGYSWPLIRAAARRAAGERLDPLVLRANAGDCVDLVVINGLRESSAGQGLKDTHNGRNDADALMPKIVSLNVASDSDGENLDTKPSASVAISTSLSMRDSIQLNPFSYGLNAGRSLPPANALSAKAQTLRYYAGRISFKGGLLDHKVKTPGWCTASGMSPVGMSQTDPVYGPATANDTIASIYGRTYRLTGLSHGMRTRLLNSSSAERLAFENCVNTLLTSTVKDQNDENSVILHTIPYAFGPVPLKPMGDVFGQLAHGLYGTIIVEPKGASYPGRTAIGGLTNVYRLDPGKGDAIATHVTFTEAGKQRKIREVVVFFNDGLNLWDKHGFVRKGEEEGLEASKHGDMPIKDCKICDDTYDFGEKATGYRTSPFFARLRHGYDPFQTHVDVSVHDNLNQFEFPSSFFTPKWHEIEIPSVSAEPGEEVVFRVIHPGGRARQRAFVASGFDYDDLFPGFGFPHSSLLAPGKAISAIVAAPVEKGCMMWRDGPAEIWASGVWGMLDVHKANEPSSCSRY